jgi:FG-GAP-like repeat/FG-GAP repeat
MKRSAGLLACLGVALVLGALARAAAAPAPSFAQAARYVTGAGPSAIAVGDLNGDGRPDLATANAGVDPDECSTHSVSVLLNRGSGRFGAKQDYPGRRCPAAIAIGDLNGDGKPDLVTANWADPDSPTSTVSVFANRGDGTFGPRQDFATASGAASIAIADVNGDGASDVITSSGDSFGCAYVETVSVLLNRGDGTFQPRSTYSVGSCPYLAVGDVNGDGAPDIVTAEGEDNAVSVLLGNGDGTFQARRVYKAGQDPESVAIGDLNADGKQDLVVSSGMSVDVLLNAGDGSFRAAGDYLTGQLSVGGQTIAIADLSGDGVADVVVTSSDPEAVMLLVNRGNGRLRPELDYLAGWPLAIAAADLNGDRRVDVVATDDEVPRVSLLLNRPGLCDVQLVRGLRLADAKGKLARAHCRVGRVRFVHSKDDPKGRVVKQRPRFGAVRPARSRVDLFVSLGRR